MTILEEQTIKCPHCGALNKVAVEWRDGEPWPRYAHECASCGYLVTESEWVAISSPTSRAADQPKAGG